MKLPAVQKAIVPRTKITDYLLCLTHTNGQSKARFFLNQGFCFPKIKHRAIKTIGRKRKLK
jgi:hypothetical protein